MDVITPGTILLGKFRVERVLGKGGMGIVVAARHVSLDEPVAIKFLLPEVVDHPNVVERFLREARASVKIKSEHVARVTDVGTMESGSPYMVMEYLDGCDLGELLARRGRLEIAEACEYILQACEALAEAHAMGVVHRDIKPANLFLTRRADGSPCVKVLDFGISKVRGGGENSLTKTGGMMGSPLYMSPEQLSSAKHVDPRADVYALGVVLFELVTGMPPYDGEEIPQLVVQVLHAPIPSLRAFRPDAPASLEAIITGCLAKDRNARIADVGQLARGLAEVAPHARISADRTGRIVAGSDLARSYPNASSSSSSGDMNAMPPSASPAVSSASPGWRSQTENPATHTSPGTAPARSRSVAIGAAFFGSAVVACIIALVAIKLASHHDASPRDDRAAAAEEDDPSPKSDPTSHDDEDDEKLAPAKTMTPAPMYGSASVAPPPVTPPASASASTDASPSVSTATPAPNPPPRPPQSKNDDSKTPSSKPTFPAKPAKPKKADEDPFQKSVL